jgi:hypothetical protein
MNPCNEATANFDAPLQKLADHLDGRLAIYVSAPITTGWRFLVWYKTTGHALKPKSIYKKVHAREVVARNCAEALSTIDSIRRQYYPTPVVEPVTFTTPGWTQSDYRCFWGKVIERFVNRTIFFGWLGGEHWMCIRVHRREGGRSSYFRSARCEHHCTENDFENRTSNP